MSFQRTPSRATFLAAFAVVYLVWGSSFLAIRIGLEGIPPLALAAIRSLIGGALLYGWGRATGGAPLSAAGWRVSLAVGALFFFGGHGGLFWAMGRVPSGIAAVLFATMPAWMTLAQTVGTRRLDPRAALAVLGGIAGVVLLVGPGRAGGQPLTNPLGALVVVLAAMSWAAGSVIARRSRVPSVGLATGSYLLAGGGMLLIASALAGELTTPSGWAMTTRAVTALVYLIAFGTVLTLVAYNWLLRHLSLVAVSTYAYVNPVVALALGWLYAGEPLGPRVVLAAALILASVAVMLTSHRSVPAAVQKEAA
jgi:drug/metabolite transporter (DMT)-like permease